MAEADEDELVLPVPTSSHRFKRFGTVRFSDPPYHQSHLSSSLATAGSLLAVSNRYGRLFIVPSSQPSTLLVASTSAVVESVESDKREQAAEAEQDGGSEGSKLTSDAAASPTVFVPVTLSHSQGLRHVSLSPDDDWLVAVSDDGVQLYHISQFDAQEGASSMVLQPHHSIQLNAVDVQWWPPLPSLLLALDRRGQLTCHQVTPQGVVERWRYSSAESAITAFSVPSRRFTRKNLYLGHADGSLHCASFNPVTSDSIVVDKRLPAHNPSAADFPSGQPALHFISQPSASTLLLGYALSRSADVELTDYLTDSDVERIAMCSFNLTTSSYCYLGDVLQDELRMMDEGGPYLARHRYTALALPALDAAVLYSNRAGETAILGPDPTETAIQPKTRRWVAYEMQQDTDRAMVPCDSEWKDTYALGMAFDVTNRLSTADSVAEQKSELDAPMPLLFMLTSDARLHMYHFVCQQPSMAEASKAVMHDTVEAMPTSVTHKSDTSEERQHTRSKLPTAAAAISSSEPIAAPTAEPSSAWSFSAPTFTFSTSAAAPSFSFGSAPTSNTSSTPSLFSAPATLSSGSPSPAFSNTNFAASASWASLGSSASSTASAGSFFNPVANGTGMASVVNTPSASTTPAVPNPFSSFPTASFAPLSASSSSSSNSLSSTATTSGASVATGLTPSIISSPGPTTFAALASKQSAQWECETCLMMNSASATHCQACESAKPGTADPSAAPASAVAPGSITASGFSFGAAMPAFNFSAALGGSAGNSATALSGVRPAPGWNFHGFMPAAPAVSASSGLSTNSPAEAKLTPSAAAKQTSTAASSVVDTEVKQPNTSDDDGELCLPVPSTSHRFKRFGTVQFSSPPYWQTDTADPLHRVASLLAVANRYGRLFIYSSSTPPRLLVASTSTVLEAVEADKREQAEEAEDDSKRVSDAAASPDVFVPVSLGDSEHVWHLSLSSDEQWLLVMDSEQGKVYHISQLAQAEAEQHIDPHDAFFAHDYIDVQWSHHHPSVLYLLDYFGVVRAMQVTEAGCIQVLEKSFEEGFMTSAMCVSPFTSDELWQGYEDGSLSLATVDLAAGSTKVIKRFAAHNPSAADFPSGPSTLQFISQPSASTLLLGYALSRSADVELTDYLTDSDVERIAMCSFNLTTSSYCYLGDVLQDELRMMDEGGPYLARHRYTALALPALDAAVLYSNRAGETAILGPDPTETAIQPKTRRWVAYEMQQDTDRAMVPCDSEWKDTYALGMAFDVTNRLSTADSVAEQKSELDAPMPLLFMLTSDARLHMYHFVCQQPSMAEASMLVMKATVEELPEEETYEELFTNSRTHSSAPAAATAPSLPARAGAVTASQPATRPPSALPSQSTTQPSLFGSSAPTTVPPFSFDSSKSAIHSTAAPGQSAPFGQPTQSLVSNAPPFGSSLAPNVTAPPFPAFGSGATSATTAHMTNTGSPSRPQKRSAASVPDHSEQTAAQPSRQHSAPAPPTLAEALSMLAAALPNASPNEASIALSALRGLLSLPDFAPTAMSSSSSTSNVSSHSPVPAPVKPVASVDRASRTSTSDGIQHTPERSPPVIPASLSRPVEYVSSLDVDDFRLAFSSASDTEKTFRHALTQLAKEMAMLRDITQDSQQLLRKMYEPQSNAQQRGTPTFSVHSAYRQQRQIGALREAMDELSGATKEQEKALDDVLSYTQDNMRRVTALQLAEERGEDEEWRELVRNQPLSREAVLLTERIVGKLAELKKRRQELEEAVGDEWKRVKGHGRLGYNEDELTVAGVHRIIDNHRALIDQQREEVRRLKDALRRGQLRTTTEEREVRLLFSETPLKALAGKRGWDKDERKLDEEDDSKRLAAPIYAKGATPAKAPIIESALQQRAGASPAFTTPPVSRQKFYSSSQLASSPPSLTPATLSRINASFQQKLLQSSAAATAAQPTADRQQGAERIAQLMRRSEEARVRAQAAFLSPLPSTLQLRSGGSADRGKSLQEAMAEVSGGRRWSRTKPQAEKAREEEERKEKDKQRAREEEAKQTQQMLAQLMRGAQSGGDHSSAVPEPTRDGLKAKRAAPSRSGSSAAAPSGFAPGFSFSGFGQTEQTTGTSAAASASPPPFNFQFKMPPPIAAVETVEAKEEQPTSKRAFAPMSPPSSTKPAVSRAAAAATPTSSLPSDGQGGRSASAAAAESSGSASALVLPESPSLTKRKPLSQSPPPAAVTTVPVPPKPVKPAAAAASSSASPAAVKPTNASASGLFSPSAASASSFSTAASMAGSNAVSTASTTTSSSGAPATSTVASAPSAPAFSFSTSAAAPSFSLSTSAAAPSFSFSTSAAAPSFSFSAPPSSAPASVSSSVSSLPSSTASTMTANRTIANAETKPLTPFATQSSSATTASSFGLNSSLGASTKSSFASPFANGSSSAPAASFSFSSPSQSGDTFGLSGLTSALSESSSSSFSAPFGSSSASPFAAAFPAPSAADVANPFAAFTSTSSSLSFGTPSTLSSLTLSVSPFAAPSFDTTASSANSLRSLGNVFGSGEPNAASNPFQTVSSNAFQAAPTNNGMATSSNPFALPTQAPAAQPSQFGNTQSVAPAASSPFAAQSFGGIASPFDSSAVFGSGGFGQSFSSAAFGGGMSGSSAPNPFGQVSAPSAFGGGGGFGGGGFSAFSNSGPAQSGFASFAPQPGSGFGSFAQPASAGGSGFGALAGSAAGASGGGGFGGGGGAGATGGFGNFSAAAQQGGGGGWGLGGNTGNGLSLPQPKSFGFDTSGFRS